MLFCAACGTETNPWEGPEHAADAHPEQPWIAEALAAERGISDCTNILDWLDTQPVYADVLFMDDNRPVPNELRSRTVIAARTTAQAIAWLYRYAANQGTGVKVWFDHDMGPDLLGGEDLGVRTSRWLRYRAATGTPVSVAAAFVHTSNPEGGSNIMSDLRSAGIPATRVPSPAQPWDEN